MSLKDLSKEVLTLLAPKGVGKKQYFLVSVDAKEGSFPSGDFESTIVDQKKVGHTAHFSPVSAEALLPALKTLTFASRQKIAAVVSAATPAAIVPQGGFQRGRAPVKEPAPLQKQAARSQSRPAKGPARQPPAVWKSDPDYQAAEAALAVARKEWHEVLGAYAQALGLKKLPVTPKKGTESFADMNSATDGKSSAVYGRLEAATTALVKTRQRLRSAWEAAHPAAAKEAELNKLRQASSLQKGSMVPQAKDKQSKGTPANAGGPSRRA